MNESAGSFLFRGWPYLAITLFAVGLVLRLLVTSDRIPALRRVLPQAKRVFLGGWLWRASWGLLAAAHLAGLLFPRAILGLTAAPWRLFALEALGFAVGLTVFAACLRSAWLHLRRPRRDGWSLVSDFADSAFLSLLFVGVASGLLAASIHRWGSAWGAVTLAPYAASLVHGRPMPAFVEHLPVLIRLHLFAAFAAIAVFPATRLAAFPLVLTHRALAAGARGFAAAARPARALMRTLASWLWPEAEYRWITKPALESGRKPAGKIRALWPPLGREGGAVIKQTGGKAV